MLENDPFKIIPNEKRHFDILIESDVIKCRNPGLYTIKKRENVGIQTVPNVYRDFSKGPS